MSRNIENSVRALLVGCCTQCGVGEKYVGKMQWLAGGTIDDFACDLNGCG